MKHLSKIELQKCLEAVLQAHEEHYVAVKNDKQQVMPAFFMLSGNIIAIRERFKLPALKER